MTDTVLEQVQQYIEAGRALVQQDPAQALPYFQHALVIAQQAQHPKATAEASLMLGHYALDRQAYQDAATYFHHSADQYRQSADVGGQANALLQFGLAIERMGDVNQAVQAYTQCVTLCRTLPGMEDRTALALSLLGYALWKQNQPQAAFKPFTDSLQLLQKLNDHAGIARVFYLLSFCSNSTNEIEATLHQFSASLWLSKLIGDEENVKAIFTNITHIKNSFASQDTTNRWQEAADEILANSGSSDPRIWSGMIQKTAFAFCLLGTRAQESKLYDQVQMYYTQAVVLWHVINEQSNSLGSVLRELGLLLEARKEYDEALACYVESLEICEKTGFGLGQVILLRDIGNTLVHLNQAETALQYYRKSVEIGRSIGEVNEAGLSEAKIVQLTGQQPSPQPPPAMPPAPAMMQPVMEPTPLQPAIQQAPAQPTLQQPVMQQAPQQQTQQAARQQPAMRPAARQQPIEELPPMDDAQEADLVALVTRGHQVREAGSFAEARRIFQTVIQQSSVINHPFFLIDGFYGLATVAIDQQQHDEALDYLARAWEQCPRTNAQQSYGQVASLIGSVYEQIQDISQALNWYRRSITTYERDGNDERLILITQHCASLYANAQQFSESIDMALIWLNSARRTGDQLSAAQAFAFLAFVYPYGKEHHVGGVWHAIPCTLVALRMFGNRNDDQQVASLRAHFEALVEHARAMTDPVTQLSLELANDFPGGFPASQPATVKLVNWFESAIEVGSQQNNIMMLRVFSIEGAALECMSGNIGQAADMLHRYAEHLSKVAFPNKRYEHSPEELAEIEEIVRMLNIPPEETTAALADIALSEISDVAALYGRGRKPHRQASMYYQLAVLLHKNGALQQAGTFIQDSLAVWRMLNDKNEIARCKLLLDELAGIR